MTVSGDDGRGPGELSGRREAGARRALITVSPLCHKLVNQNYPPCHTKLWPLFPPLQDLIIVSCQSINLLYPFVSPRSLKVLFSHVESRTKSL